MFNLLPKKGTFIAKQWAPPSKMAGLFNTAMCLRRTLEENERCFLVTSHWFPHVLCDSSLSDLILGFVFKSDLKKLSNLFSDFVFHLNSKQKSLQVVHSLHSPFQRFATPSCPQNSNPLPIFWPWKPNGNGVNIKMNFCESEIPQEDPNQQLCGNESMEPKKRIHGTQSTQACRRFWMGY